MIMELGFPSTFMETLETELHAECLLLLSHFTSLACIVVILFVHLFVYCIYLYVYLLYGVMRTTCTWRSELQESVLSYSVRPLGLLPLSLLSHHATPLTPTLTWNFKNKHCRPSAA